MSDKSKLKTAMILNFINFVLEVFANCWMMSGITIHGEAGTLSAARLAMFRYFTVDSNVLMGVVALAVAIEQCLILKGKKEELSKAAYIWMLIGTAGVTLTMFVTVFFLAPTMAAEYGLFANFKNSNFFLHLLNPILSIVTLCAFMKNSKIHIGHTVTGIIPLLLYAVYYVTNAVVHAENGMILKAYDWYGFFMLGVKSIFFVLPIVICAAYLFSLCLWKLSRKK